MTINLENTIALVTGAAGGIGRAVCATMTDAGAKVIATDIADKPDDLVAEAYYKHDVTSQKDWQKIADKIESDYGQLDALVNVAGLSIVASIEETSLSEWQRVNGINVESILLSFHTMLPLLKKSGKTRKGGASVVNFSSIAGQRGAAFNAAYCASKGAVKIFTKCAAIEFAALGYNIRVNSIHPGGVETPMLKSIIDTYIDKGVVPSHEIAEAGIIADHPMGRLGVPEDLGGGVV
ncbi:MAG: SDR family NAD(P)-dependent oxidoreductase, partial [Pseudomonadota bacterium]|nr:SDR family NAD(P)-dependent oxidoreductase [Pseudomonadota bacterium]